MKIIDSPADMLELSRSFRKDGKSIGFIPTMGALHNGHVSLIRACRKDNDISVVSIFVNPLQFSKGEDFDKYPRQLDLDKRICDAEGIDVLFIPTVGYLYPKGFDTFVDQSHYVKFLCGPFRPMHFRGVMTIVTKLFNIVQPDKTYFGQKDYQQQLIIRRMIEDLNLPIKLKMLPTVREEDGLAISSRNAFLGPKQRKQASSLYQALMFAQGMVSKNITSVKKIKSEMEKLLKKQKGLRIDYIEICNAESLEPLNEVKSPTLIAAAIKLGNTRLIDNIVVIKKG